MEKSWMKRNEGKIDDQTGYIAYCLLYNSWNDTDERHKEEIELTFKLAKRVIEILDVATVSCKAKELIN